MSASDDIATCAAALGVPGVADATVYPLRQGPGTVDIVIVGEDGITECGFQMMRRATAKAAP